MRTVSTTFVARASALSTPGSDSCRIRAHCSIRKFHRVRIWDRNVDKASRLAQTLDDILPAVEAAAGIEAAVGDADLVSSASPADAPPILGAWLSPGTHLDLKGGFTPDIRETDNDAVCRCTVFVDQRDGAAADAVDIADPLAREILGKDGVAADLFDLCRGRHPGRQQSQETTLFKSNGTGLEDLAAARLAFESSTG